MPYRNVFYFLPTVIGFNATKIEKKILCLYQGRREIWEQNFD